MTDDYIALAKSLRERVDTKQGPNNEREFCDAMVEQMRKDRLLAVAVPPTHDGPGLGVEDVSRITFEIARQSGSVGLIYAMHMSQVFSVVSHGSGSFFDDLQKRMVKDQLLVASGTSEKGPGGDIFTSICTVEEDTDGSLKINKSSPNISYVDHADLILVTANYQEGDQQSRQRLIAASVEQENFETGFRIDLMGLRGILNCSYDFQVRFEAEAIFEDAFGAVARNTMTPVIQILWASLWSGIAYSMIEKAKRFVTEEIPGDGELSAVVHHELTRMIDLHHMMNVLVKDAIVNYENRGDSNDVGFGLSAKINRLKVDCSELLIQIGVKSMNLIGIRAYARGGPYSLAEPMADAFSGPIMVSNYRLALNTAKIERFVDERL